MDLPAQVIPYTRTELELKRVKSELSQKNKARLAAFVRLPLESQACLDDMIIKIVEDRSLRGIGWIAAFEIVACFGEYLAKRSPIK